MGKNIIFGVDINSSVPTQRLVYSTLTVEAKHPINFIKSGKRFVLMLNHNGSNSFLFVNATKIYQFKTKNSEKKRLCLQVIFQNIFHSVDYIPINTN